MINENITVTIVDGHDVPDVYAAGAVQTKSYRDEAREASKKSATETANQLKNIFDEQVKTAIEQAEKAKKQADISADNARLSSEKYNSVDGIATTLTNIYKQAIEDGAVQDPIIDDNLNVSGAGADAKFVGEKFSNVEKNYFFSFPVYEHIGYLTPNDTFANNNATHCLYTDIIPVKAGDIIKYKGLANLSTVGAIFYNKNGNIIGTFNMEDRTLENAIEVDITIPQNATSARFSSYSLVNENVVLEFCFQHSDNLTVGNIGFLKHYIDNNYHNLLTTTKNSSRYEIDAGEEIVLVNDEDCERGYVKKEDGNIANDNIGKHTDYIDLDLLPYNIVYRVTCDATMLACLGAIYDENHKRIGIIEDVYGISREEYTKTVELDNFKICKIDIISKYHNAKFVRFSTLVKPLNVYYKKTIDLENFIVAETQKSKGNILAGKKWYCCGDSFSEGDFTNSPTNDYLFTEGIYRGLRKVYSRFIAERNNMNLQLLAKCGATCGMWKNDTQYNNDDFNPLTDRPQNTNTFFYDQIKKINVDADYITLWFGINDSARCELGTITDETIKTFYGALNWSILYLITNFPMAHIGLIVTNWCDSNYQQAVRDVAMKWGIPFLDMEADIRIPTVSGKRSNQPIPIDSRVLQLRWNNNFRVASNNGHPNEKAHEYESTFIENFLRSL